MSTSELQSMRSNPNAHVFLGAFGAVYATRTRHHKQLSCLTLRVSHRVWIEPEESQWLSTSELQSKRSNPNARLQMGVHQEAAPLPPNHGGDGFLT